MIEIATALERHVCLPSKWLEILLVWRVDSWQSFPVYDILSVNHLGTGEFHKHIF